MSGGRKLLPTIADAATAFSFGENPASAGETIIGMRPQPEEESATLIGSESIDATLYQVAVSREDFMPKDSDGDGYDTDTRVLNIFPPEDGDGGEDGAGSCTVANSSTSTLWLLAVSLACFGAAFVPRRRTNN